MDGATLPNNTIIAGSDGGMGVTGNGGGGGTTGGGEAKVNGSATKLLEAPPVVSTSNMITAT